MKSSRTRTLIVLVLIFSLAAPGCYGSFSLTKKLYEFNGSIKDKYVRSLVTAGMMLFPVYWFGGAIDWILLNTIEFWTGKNPLTQEIFKKSSDGDVLYAQTFRRTLSGLETKIDAYQRGTLVGTATIFFQENSSIVTADLFWAGTGFVEHYTAQRTDDGRIRVVRNTSIGDKTVSLIGSDRVNRFTAKVLSWHETDPSGSTRAKDSTMLTLLKP